MPRKAPGISIELWCLYGHVPAKSISFFDLLHCAVLKSKTTGRSLFSRTSYKLTRQLSITHSFHIVSGHGCLGNLWTAVGPAAGCPHAQGCERRLAPPQVCTGFGLVVLNAFALAAKPGEKMSTSSCLQLRIVLIVLRFALEPHHAGLHHKPYCGACSSRPQFREELGSCSALVLGLRQLLSLIFTPLTSSQVVLYFISAMHKLNSDWFDTRVSCASSVTGTLLAQYVPTTVPAGSSLSRLLLESAPYAAVAFEVFLPSLLALAPPGRSTFWQGACIRLAVVLGSIFHLTLALPLPPASFYPFSASCLALYPLLMPDACEKLAQLREFGWGKLVGLSLPGLMLSICAAANLSEGVTYEQAGQCNRCSAEEAGAWSSWLKGGPQDVPFEYPPYDLYNAGICWCLGVTTFLSLLALLGKGSNEDGRPVSAAAAIAVVATLLLGLGPYLGTRTYPAFAMFSNLRVEGSRPNHLLLGGGLDLLGLQSDAVEVDLSQLFTSQTQSYFAAAGLEKALWICPPKWPHSVEFQAFSAPALGLWQRFNHHENGTEKQWYARVRRGGVETIVRSIDDFKGRCDRGVPGWLCKLLGPFRSFNDEHSPSRAPFVAVMLRYGYVPLHFGTYVMLRYGYVMLHYGYVLLRFGTYVMLRYGYVLFHFGTYVMLRYCYVLLHFGTYVMLRYYATATFSYTSAGWGDATLLLRSLTLRHLRHATLRLRSLTLRHLRHATLLRYCYVLLHFGTYVMLRYCYVLVHFGTYVMLCYCYVLLHFVGVAVVGGVGWGGWGGWDDIHLPCNTEVMLRYGCVLLHFGTHC
eukprot:s1242_g5.t19